MILKNATNTGYIGNRENMGNTVQRLIFIPLFPLYPYPSNSIFKLIKNDSVINIDKNTSTYTSLFRTFAKYVF